MELIVHDIRSESAALPLPAWKRILDIGLILLSSPFLIPLLGLIGLSIWLVSPGPILFRQKRIGHRGKPFEILKFRSMRVAAETQGHEQLCKQLMASQNPMTKLDRQDKRIIPGGRLLRASGLDELPQLINVLRGEMSLVGPRPCIPYEYENYTAQQKKRFLVVPGLTGLWQVSGKNQTTFEEMIRLDIRYAQRCSLGLDLWIIAKTLPVLLGQMVQSKFPGLMGKGK